MQQRQCLILQGDTSWLNEQAQSLFDKATDTQRLWLSNNSHSLATPLKKTTQYLGRELSCVVFDCCQSFSADALGAIIGSLKAGGVFIVLVPERITERLWLQRFMQIAINDASIHIVQQPESVPAFPFTTATSPLLSVQPSTEQALAIEAVLKVVSGHRRRPLVISSDRGRGKTALLGMAAAELLKLGKTRILVTGPGKANIETFMHHARLQLRAAEQTTKGLTWQQGKLEFVAPDLLLKQQPAADLLIVDEAAAIPVSLLEQMLKAYSRVVFATTLHGYEGTGRGFILRFQKTLDRLTPNWRSFTLTQPIRWSENDRLEQFSFDALLLNAEPVDAKLIDGANEKNVNFEQLSPDQLLQNEALLRQIFGLMVLAHYRTRPSDLQMLLEQEGISIAVLRYQQHIVATAWLVEEPALDDELAAKVFSGTRRLKGHLLPQSLLAHAGLPDAGQYHYQRIIRIAVHPELQSQKLGSYLLHQLKQNFQGKTDLLGTSFAMEERVFDFWLKNGLKPVRLGQHQDQVSGSIAVLMLTPISDKGSVLFATAEQLLKQQWPFLLQRQLKALSVAQVTCLTQGVLPFEQTITTLDIQQINSFAYAQRTLESTDIALWKWLSTVIGQSSFRQLETQTQALLMMLIMQQRDIKEVIASFGFNGRAELIAALRQAVSDGLSAISSLETK